MTSSYPLQNHYSVEGVKRELLNRESVSSRLDYMRALYATLNRNPNHVPDFSRKQSMFEGQGAEITVNTEKPLGVIIESRQYPVLPDVVNEFIQQLGIHVQLFHGPSSLQWIKQSELRVHLDEGNLTLTQLTSDRLPPSEYNALLLNSAFWDSLISRDKILLFQCDAALCKDSDYSLSDFLHYDYVGSRWPNKRPVGVTIAGGNGGFSIRDWTQSVECLKQFPALDWPGAEDTFFAFHMSIIGANVASDNACEKFATQHAFVEKSFGAHKIQCLSEQDRHAFLQYCPTAQRILA